MSASTQKLENYQVGRMEEKKNSITLNIFGVEGVFGVMQVVGELHSHLIKYYCDVIFHQLKPVMHFLFSSIAYFLRVAK
eukprot:gene774-4062_t